MNEPQSMQQEILNDSIMSIFAHQDDETFSAGGTLAKYKKAYAVSVTLDPKRENEFDKACKLLGIQGIQLSNQSINHSNEIQIKNQLIDLIRMHKPMVIITHTDFDYHFEHKYVRKIVEEAVEWASHTTSSSDAHQIRSLYAAETTILIPFPNIYIDITSTNQKRLQAIECYKSQSYKGGDNFYSKFHFERTKLRGIQSGAEHAEAFLQIPITISGSFKPRKVFDTFP